MRRKRCNCPCGARLSRLDAGAVWLFFLLICLMMFVIVFRGGAFLSSDGVNRWRSFW